MLTFAVIILSFIYGLIDIYPNYSSVHDLGYSMGVMFGNMFKILGTLSLFILGYRKFTSIN